MPWYWYGELESSENRLDLARGVKILHMWSYTFVGVGVDENLTDSWTPGAKDFLPKKKKFQPKPKKPKRSRAQKVNKTLENESVEKDQKQQLLKEMTTLRWRWL